jgi:hypothetical protein
LLLRLHLSSKLIFDQHHIVDAAKSPGLPHALLFRAPSEKTTFCGARVRNKTAKSAKCWAKLEARVDVGLANSERRNVMKENLHVQSAVPSLYNAAAMDQDPTGWMLDPRRKRWLPKSGIQ